MNGIGQGSFGAALCSSINIGSAVHEVTKNDPTANIGNLKLNSLIFQDDIARMNSTMDQARQGAQDIGRLLESKQLRANIGKSKAVIMGPEDAREEMLKNIKQNPIRMGGEVTEDSVSEKYLGDWIHQERTTMSVSETIRIYTEQVRLQKTY